MATPHKRQFSALLVQDVMDTLFARRVSGELFTADDEKALSNAMRRGGSRTVTTAIPRTVSPVVANKTRVQTQRVPADMPKPKPVEPTESVLPQPLWFAGLGAMAIASVVSLQAAVMLLPQAVCRFTSGIMDATTFEWQRCVHWLQTGLRKRRLLAKQNQRKKQRIQLQQAALAEQQALLTQQQQEQETEAANLQVATATIPTTPRAPRESIPMAATVTTPPESYALMALPTVQQRPDLQVFITESLPTAVAEVEASPEVSPARPVVTPLVSDAAVRTLMAHHPKPESLAPNSETERLLQHNRFLAHSINNLAERYFSLQHPSA